MNRERVVARRGQQRQGRDVVTQLAVPEHVLTKPGKLSPEEFAKMKVHPVVGAEIVEQVQFPYPVAPIVRAHHERWDGGGYPDGLEGEAIPLGARIIAIADAFESAFNVGQRDHAQ